MIRFLAISILLIPLMVSSQDFLQLAYLQNSLDFDGIVNESEWQHVEGLPLVQHQPVFGKEPTEETDIFVGYDDQYLYLAARMYYRDPGDMQNTTKKRDAMVGSTEYLGLILDTFNDNENALAFFTTPAGLRWDGTVFNDAEGEMPINLSWNTFWDVKVDHTDYGWQAEMRIPFTSLRFQNIDQNVTMGMAVWRYMPHLNEMVMYPPISNDLGPWAAWKPSRMKKIRFGDVKPKKPVYVAPYILGGVQEENLLNEAETDYDRKKNNQLNGGLDLKHSFSSNLTMDVTVNPDFAQVEVDDQQVNLTRFSLFFPEKRLFFQERSSVFDFNFGGENRLFYSRKIGIEEEDQIDIYGGVRLVGRVGGMDFGLLDMQTADQKGIPSTNYGVIRARKQVINPFSYVGGMVTNKIATNGNYNTNVGADGVFRITTNDYITINYAQSYYNDTTAALFTLDDSKLRIGFSNRIIRGFGYNLSLSMVGKDYNPEMGFERREDYYRWGNRVQWGWVPSENSKLLNHNASIRFYEVRKNGTNKIESAQYGPGWQFNGKSGYFGDFSYTYNIENPTDTFSLSNEAYVLAGRYDFSSVNFILATPFNYIFNVINSLTFGEFFDGNQVVLSVSPGMRMGPSFEWEVNYLYNRIKFPDRDQEFVVHLGRVRATYMFSTKLSLSAFVQHTTEDHFTIGNFKLRYNPREGNDLFIVYNNGINSDRHREIPHLPRMDSRTLVLKYTYTFVLSRR